MKCQSCGAPAAQFELQPPGDPKFCHRCTWKMLVEAAEAAQTRWKYNVCPECGAVIRDEINHEETCRLHAIETQLDEIANAQRK
jgi:DNA-directed RNA polymerase subunit RPC12/RpoP